MTNTLVFLAMAAVAVTFLRDLIAPSEPNGLIKYEDVFMRRAASQHINWLSIEDDPFSVAVSQGRPVMVFVAEEASASARALDVEVFSSREVAARLNRQFVSVRIDSSVHPEWESGILPITRAVIGAEPGFTVWFFRPDGTPLTWSGRREWDGVYDANEFLGSLNQVSEVWKTSTAEEWTRAERDQAAERRALRSGETLAVPDFSAWSWPDHAINRPTASLYVNAMTFGGHDGLDRLKRDICSPRFDLVDGGFFRTSDPSNKFQVEFSKEAGQNAELFLVSAKAWAQTSEEIFRYAAERTFECIEQQFMADRGWVSSVTANTEPDGRSRRHSFGPAVLRTQGSRALKESAHEFGLRDRANLLAVPFIKDPTLVTADSEKLQRTVSELQRLGDSSGVVAASSIGLDECATVVARCIEAALLLGDNLALEKALGWADRLDSFRVGSDDVVHDLTGEGQSEKWLGDYVAYADANLWRFIATGESRSLDDGIRVLERAIELFSRNGETDIVACTSRDELFGKVSLAMPPVTDTSSYVALPALIRVLDGYGLVTDQSKWRELAIGLIERYAYVANAYPAAFGSFFFNAWTVLKAERAVLGYSCAREDLTRALRRSPLGVVVRRSEG